MRILRVVSSGWREGGAENGIVAMQPIFERLGHQVRTLASDSDPGEPHFNDYAFRHIRSDGPGRQLLRFVNPSACAALLRARKDFRPDVIHVHTLSQVSAAIFGFLGSTPSFLTIHGPELCSRSLLKYCLPAAALKNGDYESGQLTAKGRIQWAYLRRAIYPAFRTAAGHVDHVIALSSFMTELLGSEGLRATYVPNGAFLSEETTGPPTEPEHNRFLYVGRLEAFKGVSDAIAALPGIQTRIGPSTLVIAGDGSVRQDLEQLALDLGVRTSVRFLGRIEQTELTAEYQRSTAVLMPSTWPEAFGKAGLEALGHGRPVIGTCLGGMSDWMVHNETGIVVPPNAPRAIEEAAVRLSAEPELYRRLSSNGRTVAQRFTFEAHVAKMIEHYESALSQEGGDL